jgi:hypothetical protein
MWLGRVPTSQLLDRGAWTFYVGEAGGVAAWSTDDTIAVSIFRHPLMTAMQQVTWVTYFNAVVSQCIMPRNCTQAHPFKLLCIFTFGLIIVTHACTKMFKVLVWENRHRLQLELYCN